MNNSKTSLKANVLIWFGAGITIAEFITGTSFAPLGMGKGILAIVLGHLTGCALVALMGLIGAKTGQPAMETVKRSFGSKGGIFFSILNMLQLLGWTSVMISSGAVSANEAIAGDFDYTIIIKVLTAVLIIIWTAIGITKLEKLNTIVMGLLFILSICLLFVICTGSISNAPANEAITFGAAYEMSVAMVISWLPLISDYVVKAERPVKATFVSMITYFFSSGWMFFIGMCSALFTGENDISLIMLKAGLGIIAVVIVILSTVVSSFMDAYSGGMSLKSIFRNANEKWTGFAVCILGLLVSLLAPDFNIENLLYIIGSAFTPMAAIMITDFFIFKKNKSKESFNILNLILWVIGFVIYRLMLHTNTPVGCTIPSFAATTVIAVLTGLIANKIQKRD